MIIEHIPEVYHLTFGQHTPVMTLKDGDTVRVRVPDCDGLGPDAKPLDRSRFAKEPGNPVIANPQAGPYFIDNAVVGDSITVHIKEVKVESSFGRTGISAEQIAIPGNLFATEADSDRDVEVPKKEFSWQINHENNTAVFHCGNSGVKKSVAVGLRPSVGCIGVAPEGGRFIDGLPAGNYGGNIDIPDLTAGSSITLPVFADGAYLSLGDLHAVQGDGEIIGGAIEVSGVVTFQVRINKRKPIDWPRIETNDRIGVAATGDTIDEAMQIAYSQLVLWLSSASGLGRWEVLNIVSQTGTARPGNRGTACCTIEKKYLQF